MKQKSSQFSEQATPMLTVTQIHLERIPGAGLCAMILSTTALKLICKRRKNTQPTL
jgi:hypothetical protein